MGVPETGSLAGECRLHRGLHVLDDQVVLSVRPNSTTRPAEGELLWTTLHFTDHPVVKYESGDIATILTDKCHCGLPGEVLTGIRRKGDHFSLFGHQFDYQQLAAAVENALGEYSALQIEIDNGERPTFRFLLPSTFRQQSATISSALLRAEDLGYFVERRFVDWTLDFSDALAFWFEKGAPRSRQTDFPWISVQSTSLAPERPLTRASHLPMNYCPPFANDLKPGDLRTFIKRFGFEGESQSIIDLINFVNSAIRQDQPLDKSFGIETLRRLRDEITVHLSSVVDQSGKSGETPETSGGCC